VFKTLTVVLLILATSFSGFAQSLARVPDGLCLLLDDHGGSGYGVLIGNRIYTAAHVLEHSITAIYVTQGGSLVSVNPNLVGSHRVHSYWMDSSPLSEGFQPLLQEFTPTSLLPLTLATSK
jgi:hypothetical protein